MIPIGFRIGTDSSISSWVDDDDYAAARDDPSKDWALDDDTGRVGESFRQVSAAAPWRLAVAFSWKDGSSLHNTQDNHRIYMHV